MVTDEQLSSTIQLMTYLLWADPQDLILKCYPGLKGTLLTVERHRFRDNPMYWFLSLQISNQRKIYDLALQQGLLPIPKEKFR